MLLVGRLQVTTVGAIADEGFVAATQSATQMAQHRLAHLGVALGLGEVAAGEAVAQSLAPMRSRISAFSGPRHRQSGARPTCGRRAAAGCRAASRAVRDREPRWLVSSSGKTLRRLPSAVRTVKPTPRGAPHAPSRGDPLIAQKWSPASVQCRMLKPCTFVVLAG